jgi:release factor glutamine methyltransferase
LALEKLQGIAQPHVLDVGTGSGAIAVTIGAERPDAVIMATDASAEALSLAAQNARRHGVAPELELSELLAAPAVAAFARSAHMIVTNLPYLPDADRHAIAPEVRHDPELALYGGQSGAELFLELLAQAGRLLPAEAWLVAELDPRNVRQVAAEVAPERWRLVDIARDLAGRDRFLVLQR